jgi:hypothetical protein
MKRGSETATACRLGLACLAMLSAAALTGCDQFNSSFNASFDKRTHDTCLPSAEAHGATAAVAETYCTCVVGQLDKLTVAQKMALNGSSPELQQAASACNGSSPAAASNDAAAPAETPAPAENTPQ